jgi:peptidyl-prolyl cis-trans isomerase D
MTVLSKIRNRAGLLVAIIGIALLSFVLADAWKSGSSIFGNSQRYVGEIAGEKVDVRQYESKVNQSVDTYKKNNMQGVVDDNTTDMLQRQTWDQMVNEIVMNKEYESLGITVSEDELADAMLGNEPHPALVQVFSDRQTGKVSPEFADPRTGQLDMAKVRNFVNTMQPEQEAQWIDIENYVRTMLRVDKYNNFIKKGLYTTTAQAKREFSAENNKMDLRYVVKRYNTVPDSTVQVSDADISKYYNEHQNEFKVAETTRKIEYVAFEAVASDEDIAAVRTELTKLAEELKSTKEDSAFIVRESDTRMFDNAFYAKDALSPNTDTLFNAPVGTVIGPYTENNAMKVSKLVSTKSAADSARVRHILIGYAGVSQTSQKTKEQAKVFSDSLVAVIKSGKAKFEELVDKYSEDPGKNGPEVGKGKGGDYGWLNAQSGFVEPFKNAGLDNKKGDIVVVESQFGYHIIEVLDSKGSSKRVQLATIERVIQPSDRTLQSYYQKASDFAGKYNTAELFGKGVEEQKLTKRVADNVKEGERNIAGLESPKPLVKWMYQAEMGQVSDPFEFGNKFVVAHLAGIKEKGIAPLEMAKDQAKEGAIREKKAEKFMADLNAALSGAKSIDDVSKKVNEPAVDAKDITFAMYSIPGAGSEGDVLGTASAMKPNQLSKPIKGKTGVYVVVVNKVQETPVPADLNEQKKKSSASNAMRVDYEVFDALKEKADIVDNRAKFGY